MKKSGFGKARRKLLGLGEEVDRQFERANHENAKDIVALAKVLIPQKTGVSRQAIRYTEGSDGGVLIDFGPKSKVIEGDSGPRPFVNPTMAATKKTRRARNRKAVRDAIKAVK